MARLNTRYYGSCSAERGVTSVLRSAAVKKVVPILSIRVACSHLKFEKPRVLFVMTKRHPVKNSQLMKVIRDVHSFFQEESFNVRNNQPV
jgi:hypothetical protein